ncbi:MAG: aldehyde dehydrogenase family protein, partial [Actinobacteria bacterium]|nr:aldehyde dehydrogenase family protein [Actinomycetota bacterium]
MEKIANFINGKSVQSSSGETTQIVDPSTGKAYAEAPKSNQADIDAAMSAAATAFEEWRDTTPSERQRALLKIADAIESRAEEFIATESKNTGKPLGLTAS